MPLVSQDKLIASLENFVIRNQLIVELSQSSTSDPCHISHLILAALLGSNFAVAVLEQDLDYDQSLYVIAVYNCTVIVEKNISLIQHQINALQSDAIEHLQSFFLEMLTDFNQNSSNYAANFGELVEYYRRLINQLEKIDVEEPWQQRIIRMTVRQCQEALSDDTINSYKLNVRINIYEDTLNDYWLEHSEAFKDKAPFLIKREEGYAYTTIFGHGQTTYYIYEKDAHLFKELPFEGATLKEVYPLPTAIRRYLNSRTKGEQRISLKYTGPFDSNQTIRQIHTNAFKSFSTLKQTILRYVGDRLGFYDLYASQMLNLYLKHFQCQTILLKASDHVIVEGLHAIQRERENTYNTVALLQIARLPAESSPIVSNLGRYGEVFGPEMVFINPRNCANHASVPAESIADMGKDIARFAQYFHQQGKNIILYAHCGSVPWITSAKLQLDEMDIPAKVIVDRVSNEMSQYYDFKTQKRMEELRQYTFGNSKKKGIPSLSLSTILYFALYYGFISSALKLLLKLANSDQKESDLLAQMPTEDYLVLQGKSKRIAGAPYGKSVDAFVHPDHDLRQVMKPIRTKTKAMLKDLYTRSCHLANLFCDNASLQACLYQLANCFTDYLIIISEAKLQKQNDKELNEIHTCMISELTTRSGAPIANYIQSFIAPPCQDIRTALLHLYEQARKVSVSRHVNSEVYYLVKLCQKIEENHDIILSMASQAKRMAHSDITILLEKLTNTITDCQYTETTLPDKEPLSEQSCLSSRLFSFFQQLQGSKRKRDEPLPELTNCSLKLSRLS